MQPFFLGIYRNRNFLKAQNLDFFFCYFFFSSTLHRMYKDTLPIPNSIGFFFPMDSCKIRTRKIKIPQKGFLFSPPIK